MAAVACSYNHSKLLAKVCRKSRNGFWRFIQEFWEEVPGAGKLVPNWHMEVIANELQEIAERVFRGEPKEYDLVFNVPPGTSKSTICSILFPAWVWTKMPSARILSASHTDALVLDLASKSRAAIKSEKYQSCFADDIELRPDQDTKSYFANTKGGDRLTCTVGGKSPMGFHAHFIIVDDPIDPKKVLSDAEVIAAREFMTNVIPTRKVDKAVSVTMLIMQRLGKRDPTDVMLEEAKKEGAARIKHFCLPSNLVEGEDGDWLESDVQPQELAKRYVNGLLDENRLGWEVLKEYKARGNHHYETQFRQKPFSQKGGLFKDTYFNQRRKAAPYTAKRIRYWDRASTEDGGCFTAGVLMAKDDEGYYVEHVVKGQWEPSERNQKMRAIALRDRTKYGPNHEPIIYVEAEGGSSGRDAWKGVMRALEGFHVKEDRPSGSKDTRAEPWSSQCAAKNVYVIDDGTWDVNDYVQEHLQFKPEPGKRLGKYKDQVDSSSGAYNILSGGRTQQAMRTYRIGESKGKVQRIVVCNDEELKSLVIDDHHTVLIVLDEPLAEIPKSILEETPIHVLSNLTKCERISFAAIDPKDYQDRWNEVLQPYDKTPEEVVMNRSHGKRLWTTVLKKDSRVDVYVVVDQDNGKALSVAYALCDTLRFLRNSSIYSVNAPDTKHEGLEPPIKHVYDMVRSCRALVMV